MDWSTILLIIGPIAGAVLIVVMDEIVALTPEDWKPLGIPVGKYDGLIWRKIKKRMGWGRIKEPRKFKKGMDL
jgi:hypothetical protein